MHDIELPDLAAGRGLFAGFVNHLLDCAMTESLDTQAEITVEFSKACASRGFLKDSVLNSLLWHKFLLGVSQGAMADLLCPFEVLPAVDSDDGDEGDEGDSADPVESDSAGAARGADLD